MEMVFLNPLNDVAEAGEDLREIVYEEPVEVYDELKKMLKPLIKMGNEQGFDTVPEKKLYKKLKNIEPAEEPDKLDEALEVYIGERTDG
jgi:hypothetical protein